jgi:hypothetical protein
MDGTFGRDVSGGGFVGHCLRKKNKLKAVGILQLVID